MVSPKSKGGRYRAATSVSTWTLANTIQVFTRATNITKRKQYSLGYRLAAPVWQLLHKTLWKMLQLLLVLQTKRAMKRKKS